MTRYLSAVMGLICGLALGACSGGDPEQNSPNDPSADEEELPVPMPSGEGAQNSAVLSVSTEGAISVTSGVAQLQVREDMDYASLIISGNDVQGSSNGEPGDNFYITLALPFADEVLGAHTSELGLPRNADNFAHVYFGASREYEYTQSGSVQVTLSPEGQIEGTFLLSVGPAKDTGRTFVATGDPIDVTGSFSGRYEKLCYSVLGGHAISLTPDPDVCTERGL